MKLDLFVFLDVCSRYGLQRYRSWLYFGSLGLCDSYRSKSCSPFFCAAFCRRLRIFRNGVDDGLFETTSSMPKIERNPFQTP